ncbi:MAG TPA: hypothetical protein VKE70_05195 [Candidatus Solibacter sp.]|nr:hypothetical protein [Candidatus Solibacter sp.]
MSARSPFRVSFLSVLLVGGAVAQTAPFETNYQFGKLMPYVNHWVGRSVRMASGTGGDRTGQVWFRQTRDGLLVFGRITGQPPQFAHKPAETNSAAYVGIWLSGGADVPMPEIAWGNQFGPQTCTDYKQQNPDLAENCVNWEDWQREYRDLLRRLFVRHWQLAPGFTVETHATPAYHEMQKEYEAPAQLEPHGSPTIQTKSSYFEVLVKWADFPPVSELSIWSLRVAVEYCDRTGSCISTSPDLRVSDPSTFQRVQFQQPKVSTITPCHYRLESLDRLSNNKYPDWYFPSAGSRISKTFSLETEYMGYRYDPDGWSPVVAGTDYFAKSIGPGETVCGPYLRYAVGDSVYKPEFGSAVKDTLEMRRLANGEHLLKSGPIVGVRNPLGTGACGVCTAVDLTIFHLSRNDISRAFNAYFVIDGLDVSDGDIQVSQDWNTVIVYKESTEYLPNTPEKKTWKSIRYCRSGTKYQQCGTGTNATSGTTASQDDRVVTSRTCAAHASTLE